MSSQLRHLCLKFSELFTCLKSAGKKLQTNFLPEALTSQKTSRGRELLLEGTLYVCSQKGTTDTVPHKLKFRKII